MSISTLEAEMYNAIRYTKTQQWLTAYYGLLVQGAIIGGFQLFRELFINSSNWECIIMLIALISIAFVGVVLYKGHNIFENYEEELEYYRDIVMELRLNTNCCSYNYNRFLIKHHKFKTKEKNYKEEYIVNTLRNVFYIISLAAIIYLISYLGIKIKL